MADDNTEIEVQINELISNKIAAGDADSGWIVAHTMLRTPPVLKEIAGHLQAINEAIAPDSDGSPSVALELRSISRPLMELAEFVKKGRTK